MSIGETRHSALAEASASIANQIAEFVSNGGKISHVKNGETNEQTHLSKIKRAWWQGASDDSNSSSNPLQRVDGLDLDESDGDESDGDVFIA